MSKRSANLVLTTQQAADLLGVTRPTVVRLAEQGELPSERIGNRRKIKLHDLLTYRDERRKRQYDAIFDTSVDVGGQEEPAVVRDSLKKIRKQRAESRRISGEI